MKTIRYRVFKVIFIFLISFCFNFSVYLPNAHAEFSTFDKIKMWLTLEAVNVTLRIKNIFNPPIEVDASIIQERAKIVEKLEELHQVSIVGDGTIFTKSFTAYLYYSFSIIEPKKKIYLYSDEENEGAQLVRAVEGQNHIKLYFSSNAPNMAANVNLDKLINSIDAIPATDKLNLTFEYNNHLFEQLCEIMLDYDGLKNLIWERYSIAVTPDTADPQIDDLTDFSAFELNLLLKNLEDLPEHFFGDNGIKLKRIVRVKSGHILRDEKNQRITSAQYIKSSHTIVITDDTFEHTVFEAENTFLHEVGHAVWETISGVLKDEYLDMGWKYNYQLGRYLRKGWVKFISSYSTYTGEDNYPGEDFPEHFAAYINNREKLESQNCRRFAWLRDNIFINTEYFTDSAENLKLFIPSNLEDVKGPFIKGQLEKSVSATFKNTDSLYFEITVDVKNLHDDLSGIKNISLELETAQSWLDGYYSTTVPSENLIDSLTGHYRFTKKVHKSNFFPDSTHKFKHIWVEDKTGNYSHIDLSKIPGLKLPGTFKKETMNSRRDLHEFSDPATFSKIDIQKFSLPNGKEAYQITLPLPEDKDLAQLSVSWEYSDTKKHKHADAGTHNISKYERISKDHDKNVRFNIAFPSNIPSTEMIYLSSIDLTYARTDLFIEERLSFAAPDSLENLSVIVNRNSRFADSTQPSINVNDINLSLIDHRANTNSNGGSKSVIVKVPLSGVEKKGKIKIGLRSPRGRTYYKSVHGSATGKNSNGEKIYELTIDLPNFNEEGTYILTEVSAEEKFNEPFDLPGYVKMLNSGIGSVNKQDIRLSQRKIRKTITIDLSKIELEDSKDKISLNANPDINELP